MSPSIMPQSLLLLISAVLLATPTLAIGDFPCAGSADSQTCAAWSADPNAQGAVAATAVCQPDPTNPSVSYCGYARAACTVALDCDYGSCGTDGFCQGYLGDACPGGNADCQAFFFCGADGTCGGAEAACANGDAASPIPAPDQQCVSQSCDSTTMICAAPPAAGVANGFGCGNAAMCASGYCSPSQICATAPAVPSGNRKAKRYVLNGSGPNVDSCPNGQLACAVGSFLSEGFECIDSNTNLEQCGGCVTDGEGEDCTAIHGVESVECISGRCLVLSCAPGLSVSLDGSSCTV